MKNYRYNIVYEVKNLINGKIYVGAHSTDNLNDCYIGSGKLIKRAVKKYGSENFTRTVLFFCNTVEEMYNTEKGIVNEEFVKREDTYNLTIGGLGVGSRSDEAKLRMSISKKGRPNGRKGKPNGRKGCVFSEEHKKRLSLSKMGNTNGLGHHCSDEAKEKISLKNTGKKRTDAVKAQMSTISSGRKLTEEHKLKLLLSHKGKHRSDETKKKISTGNVGRKCSDATKEKMSLAKIGRKLSEEHKASLRLAHKPIKDANHDENNK